MCNVQTIRHEPGLVSIPVKKAVYCGNCEKVSNSACRRCGVCGSEGIVELASNSRRSANSAPSGTRSSRQLDLAAILRRVSKTSSSLFPQA